jgi:hypothetical protein
VPGRGGARESRSGVAARPLRARARPRRTGSWTPSRRRGHIFNLGHGSSGHGPADLATLVELVHARTLSRCGQ